MIKNIYEKCPKYINKLITLRQTNLDDVQELLGCYSDEKAVPFFNSIIAMETIFTIRQLKE